MVAAVLALVALAPLRDHGVPRWWAMGAAAASLVLAYLAPSMYSLPNRAWLKLGAILIRVVSPVALMILFYGVFTPIGWIMRIAHRNPLRLSYERDARTYWIERDPPGPDGASLKNQF